MSGSTLFALKIWPEYFEAILDGRKRAEIRKNDRGFKVGDYLQLREFRPNAGDGDAAYTGRTAVVRVLHIVEGGQFGIEPGYVVMSFEVTKLLGCGRETVKIPEPDAIQPWVHIPNASAGTRL